MQPQCFFDAIRLYHRDLVQAIYLIIFKITCNDKPHLLLNVIRPNYDRCEFTFCDDLHIVFYVAKGYAHEINSCVSQVFEDIKWMSDDIKAIKNAQNKEFACLKFLSDMFSHLISNPNRFTYFLSHSQNVARVYNHTQDKQVGENPQIDAIYYFLNLVLTHYGIKHITFKNNYFVGNKIRNIFYPSNHRCHCGRKMYQLGKQHLNCFCQNEMNGNCESIKRAMIIPKKYYDVYITIQQKN